MWRLVVPGAVLLLLAGCGGSRRPFVAPLRIVSTGPIVFRATPPPASNLGRGPAHLFFFDGRHGFAATTGGGFYRRETGFVRPQQAARIQRTADGGRTWHTIWRARDLVFASIQFADAAVGLAAGATIRRGPFRGPAPRSSTVLVVTRDGGRTWRRLRPRPPFPESFGGDVPQFQLPARETWYAFGLGSLRRSGDGGVTWRPVPLPRETTVVRFATARVGYAGAAPAAGCRREQQLWRTADGARSWRPVHGTCGPPYRSLDFLGRIGLASASPSNKEDPPRPPFLVLRSTTDGGRTWRTRYADRSGKANWPQDVTLALTGRTSGWAVATASIQGFPYESLRVTSDGGRTWQRRPFPELPTAFAGHRFAWAGDEDGAILWRTRDRGRTWLVNAAATSVKPYTVAVATRSRLAITTRIGALESRDGGRTWTTARRIRPVDAARAMGLRAYVQGNEETGGSVAYATTNGGRSWRPLVSARWYGPGAVAFRDAEHGLLAGGSDYGANAPVFTTTDGGRRWRRVRLPQGVSAIADVALAPGLVVLATPPRVYLSVDEGRHWRSARLRETFWDCGAAAPSRRSLWVLCGGSSTRTVSVLFRSDDGGATWRKLVTRSPLDRHLLAVDGRSAWTLGGDWRDGHPNPLWHTTDGGRTWTAVWPRIPRDARVYELRLDSFG